MSNNKGDNSEADDQRELDRAAIAQAYFHSAHSQIALVSVLLATGTITKTQAHDIVGSLLLGASTYERHFPAGYLLIQGKLDALIDLLDPFPPSD